MIFVVLGTHEQPFERALDAIAPLAETERVVVQHGHTDPRRTLDAEWLRFADYDAIVSSMEDARAVVCHGGVGTIMTALGVGKTPVVIPRLRRFGEHVDDHQLQITQTFAGRGIVVLHEEGDDIRRSIERAAGASGTARERAGDLVDAVVAAVAGEGRGAALVGAIPEPAGPGN